MGGRGSSSSPGTGVINGMKVSAGEEHFEYYFKKHGGVNYYQNGISGIPKETPNNMSPKQFAETIKSNGGNVQVMTRTEIKTKEKEYKKYRDEMDKALNKEYVNSGNLESKQYRAYRSSIRIQKRNG